MINKVAKLSRLDAPSIKKSKTINWGFGDKHKRYIRKCRDNLINVAEGAVRAGKTIDNIFAFAMELETTPDKIHLASGSTVGNAKLNIGESNGFGLEHIFRGRSRWGKFKGNECIYIKTMTGEKVVIFVGGAKADSYKSFRGNSYGMWIATEINLHHGNTVKEAFNRQLMAVNRKIFWDLNPSKPNHWIYEKYIDRYAEQEKAGEFVGGFNHEQFTIFDNVNLRAERVKEIMSQYDVNSVWYQRDILGKRMIAEGLIYRMFADTPDRYFVKKVPEVFEKIAIGVDFGNNKSSHTFVATGVTRGYEKVIALISEKHDADGDVKKLNRQFISFVKRVLWKYKKVDYIYPDSAEQTLIRGFRNELRKENLHILVRGSKKEKIIDRIRLVTILISQDRLGYTNESSTLKDALVGAVWDDKAEGDERLDDGTLDIDTLDAFEYSIERDIRRLVRV